MYAGPASPPPPRRSLWRGVACGSCFDLRRCLWRGVHAGLPAASQCPDPVFVHVLGLERVGAVRGNGLGGYVVG
jgi:hypothetical protein